MTIEAAYHAFNVHCEGCPSCERVRVDIARDTNPRHFDRWHGHACSAGQELLKEWFDACSEWVLARSPLDVGRTA